MPRSAATSPRRAAEAAGLQDNSRRYPVRSMKVPPMKLRHRLGFLMITPLPGTPRYPTSAASWLSRPPTQVPRDSPSSGRHSVPCLGLSAPSGAPPTLGNRSHGDKPSSRVLSFNLWVRAGLRFWRRLPRLPAPTPFLAILTSDPGLPTIRRRRGALRVWGRLARLLAHPRGGPEGRPHQLDTTECRYRGLGPVRGDALLRTGPLNCTPASPSRLFS